MSLKGMSDSGPTTPAAEAPLANDKDTPTNPRVGITSFRRFRFFLGILQSSKLSRIFNLRDMHRRFCITAWQAMAASQPLQTSPTPSRRPSSSENCALASSKVATRSARVTGPLTVRDQNQAQTVGTAAGLVDATNIPLATVDGIVRAVLVDPGAEAGRAHREGHQSIAPAHLTAPLINGRCKT